jgi:hypothetical protein
MVMGELNSLHGHLASLQDQISDLRQLLPDRAPVVDPPGLVEDWTLFVFRGTIPASGQLTLTQLNDATGHFDLVEITGINQGDYELRIRENFQGKFLQQRADFVNVSNIVGTALRPYFIKGRRRFRANTTLVIEVRDLSGADNEIEIVFHGAKVSV